MTDLRDYRGCRVIVYNEAKDSAIGESRITNFNTSAYVATLERTTPLEKIPERITLCIYHPAGVYEYKGSTRQQNTLSPEVDVALYKGTMKNERTAPRYPLNTTVRIERIQSGNRLVPAQVTLVNLSSSGCLIRAGNGAFYPEDRFRISLPIQGGQIQLLATVVRICPVDDTTTDYGCALSPVQ